MSRDDGHIEGRHWFSAYRLLFASSFPIPEMVPARPADPGRAPDVRISTADFPDELPDKLGSSAVHEVNARALLLRVSGVGRYLVREGREILVDPDSSATDHDLRVYLLGTCLGALLHQRGFLVLHASGVTTEGGCLLFTGDSGAGKSTLLAEFLSRGRKMLVDDVCAVRFDENGSPLVVPSYPRTRLWADAAERMSVDTSNLPRTKASWDKFERQVPDQFSDVETPIRQVFHLTGEGDAYEFSFEPLDSIETFRTLVDNTYRGVLLDGMDLRPSHFELASRAASSIEVTRVIRPAGADTVAELADHIISLVE